MKQIVLDVSNGETKVIEVPEPSLRPGGIIVKNTFSVISFGTEKNISGDRCFFTCVLASFWQDFC